MKRTVTNKIIAIVLVFSDLQRAIDFYQNKLGLKLKTREKAFAQEANREIIKKRQEYLELSSKKFTKIALKAI